MIQIINHLSAYCTMMFNTNLKTLSLPETGTQFNIGKLVRGMVALSALILINTDSHAQSCHESGPEVHGMPPIGVMAGHTHEKGHVMFSYRSMIMSMKGLSQSGTNVPTPTVLEDYMMAPTTMNMTMHMLGAMWAPHSRLTIGVMGNYSSIKMDMTTLVHHHGEGSHDHSATNYGSSTMENSGFSDTRLMGLVRINKHQTHCLHLIEGIQLPTGSINSSFAGSVLPYAMQMGGGSFSLLSGINYSLIKRKYLVGVQTLSYVPLHKNFRGYKAPIKVETSCWASLKLTRFVSTSVRLQSIYTSKIVGEDIEINSMMSPMSQPSSTQHYLMNAHIGLNVKPSMRWRMAIEAGLPLIQHNYRVAMNQQWGGVLGLQYILP
ncbi:MAG: hypothetical protein H6608_09210 [Flavobacteriales bacterium]|nr:hypothetical protein [Bacteroidota bacterium]MCB9241299.1 hypothetical protein [Flavobacteriales bacterium]